MSMIIYQSDLKKLYTKRSEKSKRYTFYLSREGHTYKLHKIHDVVNHIDRNLNGTQQIGILFKFIIITFIITCLNIVTSILKNSN